MVLRTVLVLCLGCVTLGIAADEVALTIEPDAVVNWFHISSPHRLR